MKKFFTYLFVFFGFLFVLEVGALAYLWYADPFGVRPLIDAFTTPATSVVEDTTSETSGSDTSDVSTTDKNPALSPTQEKALETVGIDPAKLPTTITPEMKACFVATLGAGRVTQIEQGSTPTPVEILQTRACYE